MTVTVENDNGIHRAIIPFEGQSFPCCTAGHPDALSAARHAQKLARAITRKTAAAPCGAGSRARS